MCCPRSNAVPASTHTRLHASSCVKPCTHHTHGSCTFLYLMIFRKLTNRSAVWSDDSLDTSCFCAARTAQGQRDGRQAHAPSPSRPPPRPLPLNTLSEQRTWCFGLMAEKTSDSSCSSSCCPFSLRLQGGAKGVSTRLAQLRAQACMRVSAPVSGAAPEAQQRQVVGKGRQVQRVHDVVDVAHPCCRLLPASTVPAGRVSAARGRTRVCQRSHRVAAERAGVGEVGYLPLEQRVSGLAGVGLPGRGLEGGTRKGALAV